MSDYREINEVMNQIKPLPDPKAKEKAKAAFLLKAEELMESEKKCKLKFWKNKQLVYSFASGMAAMLILVVGMMSVLNPEFLTGTVRTTGYYEINSPYTPFKNGDVISADTLQEMRTSGNKFKLYMENGLALYLDRVSDGAVTLQYDLTTDAALAELLQNAAGGSIIALNVESGFTGIPVKYEIDLTRGVIHGLTAIERQKWLSALYVYCYIVDQRQLERYIETGLSDALVSEHKMLPAKIAEEVLYVNTNPGLFDTGKEVLVFTLQKIDTGSIFGSKNGGAGIGSGSEGHVGDIEIEGGNIIAP